MQVRVTQYYTRTVEIGGCRTAVIEAKSIDEARRQYAEEGIEWEEVDEEPGDCETELGDLEFEACQHDHQARSVR